MSTATILHLCHGCDAPLGADRYCASCEDVCETYEFPEGEPAYGQPGFDRDRIDMLIAESRAHDAACLAAVAALPILRAA